MLEIILAAAGTAAACSLAVAYLFTWQLRLRIWRVELELDEYQTRLVKERTARAAHKSVEVRGNAARELDARLVRQHTGVDMEEDGSTIMGAVKRFQPK